MWGFAYGKRNFPPGFSGNTENYTIGKISPGGYTLYYAILVRATGMLPNFVRCCILYSEVTFIPGKVCM